MAKKAKLEVSENSEVMTDVVTEKNDTTTDNVSTIYTESGQDVKSELGEVGDDSKKPTPEEIEKAKEEFSKIYKEFNEKTFTIADKVDSLRVVKFLKEYNKDQVLWEKDAWKGVILFDEWCDDMIKHHQALKEQQKEDLLIGYQPLEYLYWILTNPHGVGLKSAKWFKTNIEFYISIFENVEGAVIDARNQLKFVERAQQKWAAYEQGFYIDFEDEGEIDQVNNSSEGDCAVQLNEENEYSTDIK